MKQHLTRSLFGSLLALSLLAGSATANAAGRMIRLPIEDALAWDSIGEKLEDKGIKIYWSDQAIPGQITEDIEKDTYSRGVNAFLKSERRACMNAFSMTFDALIRNAVASGANAIIGITSYHDDYKDFASTREFRCDVGSFRAGVGFRVQFVKLSAETSPASSASGMTTTTPPAPR
ncbi:hypothetical protein [Viridibacterium curvum]|uniref:Uncharacterized protein n=1 Tax=Viridibacterium curvum TaxID=1101404 RepID=A0ABP9R094_9RHOO